MTAKQQSRGLDGETLPTVTAETHLRGVATLVTSGAKVDGLHCSLSRDRFNREEPWRIELIGDRNRHGDYLAHTADDAAPLQLNGTLEDGRSFAIDFLRWTGQRAGVLTGVAQCVVMGERRLEGSPKQQWVRIHLTPTDIALPQRMDLVKKATGEIEPLSQESEERRDPQPIKIGSREGRFYLGYVYDHALVHGKSEVLRIGTPSIDLEFGEQESLTDPGMFVSSLSDDLVPLLRTIGLFGRRRVDWAECRILSRDVPGGRTYEELVAQRSGIASPRRGREHLVNPYRLPLGAIRDTAQKLTDPEWGASVRAAIVYLLAAFEADLVESKLLSAFSALELAVGAAEKGLSGESGILPGREFEALLALLEETARGWEGSNNRNVDGLDQLIQKLSNLNSAPLAQRLQRVILARGIIWQDMFPDSVELGPALRRTVAQRNLLLHDAKSVEFKSLHSASVRACLLAERFLTAVTQIPKDWLDPSGNRDALWARTLAL